jgi:signal peptidase I
MLLGNEYIIRQNRNKALQNSNFTGCGQKGWFRPALNILRSNYILHYPFIDIFMPYYYTADIMEMKSKKGFLKASALALACAMVLKLLFVDLMITQGRSMLPTLKPGSLLVVNKAAFGFRLPGAGMYLFHWSSPRPGDLLVFFTPLGDRAVKRCYLANDDETFFVLGDNDLESFDSRSYGLVPLDHVLGKVVAYK